MLHFFFFKQIDVKTLQQKLRLAVFVIQALLWGPGIESAISPRSACTKIAKWLLEECPVACWIMECYKGNKDQERRDHGGLFWATRVSLS